MSPGRWPYLPKRPRKRLTEKEPNIPPTEKMATESDHRAVRAPSEMASENLLLHVWL